MHTEVLIDKIENGELDERLMDIYVDSSQIDYQRERYIKAIKRFETLYSEGDVRVFSAPGRSEICGNHTDHQRGMVLAASVNLDSIAIVRPTKEPVVRIVSGSYSEIQISLKDISMKQKEKETTGALVIGVLDGFKKR